MRPVRVDEALQFYMEGLLPRRHAVLARIEEEADAEQLPIVGPHEGALLGVLVALAGSRRILELGTAVGYSAIWMLEGAPAATLVTYEKDPRRAARARANLSEAGLGGRARVVEEDALTSLEASGERFDACFIDILTSFSSEAETERAFRACRDHLGRGGLLMADNVLRQGEVVALDSQTARNAAHYNRLAADEPGLESVVVPIRDGLSVAFLRG
ncbi:MAG: O-methyltransferase [Candidatus Dormibacterales bacterium]